MNRDQSRGVAVLMLLIGLCAFWVACHDAPKPAAIDLLQLARISMTEPVDLVQEDTLWIAGASAACVVNPDTARDPISAILAYRDSMAAYARRSPKG